MSHASNIREDMEVIGADGVHVGTVHAVHHHSITLKKRDSGAQIAGAQGEHERHRHTIPMGLVAEVEGDTVRLSATAANAIQFEGEED